MLLVTHIDGYWWIGPHKEENTQQFWSWFLFQHACQIVELDELVIVVCAKNEKLFCQCANSIACHINPEDWSKKQFECKSADYPCLQHLIAQCASCDKLQKVPSLSALLEMIDSSYIFFRFQFVNKLWKLWQYETK